ncbi:MAG: S-adenosyl-l-methionine hydroxide adenosyltransferase family protein, partial [Promethearchaeota archaeon]
DFGSRGMHYVASMKGVILKINPNVKIIDIAHDISPYSIIEASYLIKSIYKFYPEGTIFLMVIDPGVGSKREILVLKSKLNHYYIGPNNGIFSKIIKEKHILECVEIQNKEFFHLPVSNTFHGRDIMAPVAAYISKGIELKKFGTYFEKKDIVRYPITYNVDEENKIIKATVLFIDSFGNITTNIRVRNNFIKKTLIQIVIGNQIEVKFGENIYKGKITTHFNDVPEGSFLFLIGSSGYLEISKNQGNASREIGCKVGNVITINLH